MRTNIDVRDRILLQRRLTTLLVIIPNIVECGQQFHSFEIFTFIITPLSNKYVGV